MRLFNHSGRLTIGLAGASFDLERVSGGRFSHQPQAVYDVWDDFVSWAATSDWTHFAADPTPLDPSLLDCPVPSPRQIFAVGLNYAQHASESGFAEPSDPVVFAKFASSLAGPVTEVVLPEGSVDWEVELVVVLAHGGRDIPEGNAWEHVAGLTVGQDLSERRRQHSGPASQFSLAKSHAGFSPIGPAVVTIDEIDDPDDLALGCAINGETVQDSRTSDLIFTVPTLVARLSQVVELMPGDLIFTGTPSGVGAGRTPQRFLEHGDVLTSWVTGVGSIEQRLVAPSAHGDRHAARHETKVR